MPTEYQKKLAKELKSFTEKLKQIPEILAIYYTGSTATYKWDIYSDIDIDIIIADKNYEKIVKQLPKILELWGEVKQWNKYPEHDEHYAFIGKDYLKVEIDPIKRSSLKQGIWPGAKIVYDPKNIISKLKIIKEKKIIPKDFPFQCLYNRDNLIYTVRHYARGQKFSAAGELENIRKNLFQQLTQLKGLTDYNLTRTAERAFTKTEWKLWQEATCKSLKLKDFKKAFSAIWRLMKDIESTYEKKYKKLNLKCNDKEIFKLLINTLN
jgi:predicted nucleotidyltransferase